MDLSEIYTASTRFLENGKNCSEELVVVEISLNQECQVIDPSHQEQWIAAQHFSVSNILQNDSCACALLEANSGSGILTLLLLEEGWTAISLVVVAASSTLTKDKDLKIASPSLFSELASAVWKGYYESNRSCNGPGMATIFHPLARLAFVNDDKKLVAIPQADFVEMVNNRYTLPLHQKYAHLKDDPRSGAGDTLCALYFVTDRLALVKLKVGHAPCLWTDFLVVAKLQDQQWWILHKSSSHEDWLVDEVQS